MTREFKEMNILLRAVIKEMRIKQYTKNFLIYAAALFSGNIFDINVLTLTTKAFIAFSLIASVVYIVNDIMDIEKDRQHPKKKYRPIASGKISISFAILLVVIFLLAGFGIAYTINTGLCCILMMYLLMNILYSTWLKHIVLIDVMIIALGFVLRGIAGVIVIDSGTTTWFILCIFMLSLFLAIAKRRAEMKLFVSSTENTRKVLREYSIKLLDQLLTIVVAITLTSYALFAVQITHNHEYILGKELSYMIITIPIVVYGMFRYLYLIYIKDIGEAPDEILLKDKNILVTVLLYLFCIICIRSF